LSAPVVINSSNPETERLSRALFSGMDVMAAGDRMNAATDWAPSALAQNSPGGPLENLQAFSDKIAGGYALSVPYIEGDLNMAVVGTVTWREGNRLVAFGHPMSMSGSVYAPMAAARINALIRSRTRPFKLGEPVGHVGMLRQDRVPAVGGLFGTTARMFPLSARVYDSAYLGKREFQFRIWSDRHMSPGLLHSTLGETVGSAERIDGDSAVMYAYTMYLNNETSISVAYYRSDVGGSLRAIIRVMADVGMVLNNPFKRVHL